MVEFRGPVEAKNALQDFLIERTAALPDMLRERLRELLKDPSPVKMTVHAAEAVYARQHFHGDVPPEMLEWAAATASASAAHGFHSMAFDSRGALMAKVMRGQKLSKAETPMPRMEHARHVTDLVQNMTPEEVDAGDAS